MTVFLDTSVILASLDPDESAHESCDALLAQGGHGIYVQALAECFSILTGGRSTRRIDAGVATQLLKESVLPFIKTSVTLTGKEVMTALAGARERGVRGGAVYDYLHLTAAKKAGAAKMVTLDCRNFLALSKPGDPRIEAP